jgi:hypothetical protein
VARAPVSKKRKWLLQNKQAVLNIVNRRLAVFFMFKSIAGIKPYLYKLQNQS